MQTVTAILCFLFSVISYTVGYFQLKEKGILLNNAYFYASKEERERMDKSPHYRQSGIVFSLGGTIFLLYAIGAASGTAWVSSLAMPVILIIVVYAVVSSIVIEKNRRKE